MSETEHKWKTGDVVRLKSGGPAMTVDSYVKRIIDSALYEYVVRCIWFPDHTPYLTQADINEDALREVK